jgi:hypothetical protein
VSPGEFYTGSIVHATILGHYPGFRTEEIEPWMESDESWRRLKVTFPDDIASHTREQVTYFGPDGLMRRHDYSVDVLGGANNERVPEPVLISIDVIHISLHP